MKKDKKRSTSPSPPEELFDLESVLTDAAYAYGQDANDENRRTLRLAACEYAALAFKLGA